jgi:hypothetical protein
VKPKEREKKENELRVLLDRTGSYPERLRFVAWRWLLCLPNNVNAFENLEKRGRHKSLANFESKYPIRDRRLQRRLLRLLSALAHWGIDSTSFLASMIFPLAKVCGPDLRLSFELTVTICMHWSRSLLVEEENDESEILHALDACLSHHDKELWLLLQHFDVNVSVWALQPLQSIFAELFQTKSWLQLWDFLITSWRRPEYFALVTVAFVTHCRASIVSRIEEDDEDNDSDESVRRDLLNLFREHRSDLSMSEKSMMSFCRRVVRLYETTPEHIVRKLWWGNAKRVQLPFENACENDETYVEYHPLQSQKKRSDAEDEDNGGDKEEERGGLEDGTSLSLSAELLRAAV